MKDTGRLLWLAVGLVLGVAGAMLYMANHNPARAANDRYEDFIMCTGPVGINPEAPTDGVWLLDYRSGKLLGTVIDRARGAIIGWAEVDLVTEFGIAPRQNVHFLMTTGMLSKGHSALYVAETTTGKLGVYTLGPPPQGQQGFVIRRQTLVPFREAPKPGPG